jgi:hypothetical protein
MAVDPATRKISAFVVETDWPGVKVEHRCHFMGLRALANAVIRFTDVRIPAGNLIGKEGKGLKIALTTLNDGRLSIPNISVGTAKVCLGIVRRWAGRARAVGQAGRTPRGDRAQDLEIAAHVFAMESLATLATEMSDRGGYDIRLEAAAAKEWNTARAWEIVDEMMQIRGGPRLRDRAVARGARRGAGAGRAHHARLPHQQDLRGLDRDHAPVHGARDGRPPPAGRRRARRPTRRSREAQGAAAHARLLRLVVPTRFLGWGFWPRYAEFGRLATHMRFVERASRRLARASFHGMLRYQAGLQNKQAFLFRLVDIANEAFAMAATVSRAQALVATGAPRRRTPCGWRTSSAATRAAARRPSSATSGATTTRCAIATACRCSTARRSGSRPGSSSTTPLPVRAREQKQKVPVAV